MSPKVENGAETTIEALNGKKGPTVVSGEGQFATTEEKKALISDRKRWPEQLSHLRVISLLFFTFSHVTQINHGFKVASMAPQI